MYGQTFLQNKVYTNKKDISKPLPILIVKRKTTIPLETQFHPHNTILTFAKTTRAVIHSTFF